MANKMKKRNATLKFGGGKEYDYKTDDVLNVKEHLDYDSNLCFDEPKVLFQEGLEEAGLEERCMNCPANCDDVTPEEMYLKTAGENEENNKIKEVKHMRPEEIQVIKDMISRSLRHKDFQSINIFNYIDGKENIRFKNCDGFFLEGYRELEAVRFLEYLDKNIEIEKEFYGSSVMKIIHSSAVSGSIEIRDVFTHTYERDLVVLFQKDTEANEEGFGKQPMLHEYRDDKFLAKHFDCRKSRKLITDLPESYRAFRGLGNLDMHVKKLPEEITKWIRGNKWAVHEIPRDKSFIILTAEGENRAKLSVFRSTQVIRLGGDEHLNIRATQLTCDTAKVDKDRIVEEYKNKNIEFRGSHYILHPIGVSTKGNVQFLEPRRKQGD